MRSTDDACGSVLGRRICSDGRHLNHLTITVETVTAGVAQHLTGRSKLTVEDLGTKMGTIVNGRKIRGEKYAAASAELEITMGKCPSKFRITWFPVVFTFSFTSKELQTDPLTTLRERFEQLDVKLLTDYSIEHTTHVVSRKRNTAKGLQALINGKYIVTETFLEAVTQAAQINDACEPSSLEQEFDRCWPAAIQHLPPRGGEPVQHPDSIYEPDSDRRDVFEGYTFIFYDKTQYNNLMAPITNGGGKAVFQVITPGETHTDEFVRHVKQVAGEKGLGSFEDGSEGKGAVVVRFLPAKGEYVEWYTEFITAVSLRLDHRPIEQNEFLEAILTKDATKLRRPLEVESAPASQAAENNDIGPSSTADTSGMQPQPPAEEQPQPTRTRTRRPVKRRFAGFDHDADIDMDDPITASLPRDSGLGQMQGEDAGGLFVSQEPDLAGSQPPLGVDDSQARKRRASIEDDLMDGVAPAAARFKRQRIERGQDFAPPSPSPDPQPPAAPAKKRKEELDVLAMAARHREEEEARARAEREDLANLPEGIDLAEIRRLNIVEEMEIRIPAREARTREKDVADGRWNPKWNGVKNFKKFRSRGEATGRQPVRAIVTLQEVKNKEFGIGDNYWLEDEGVERTRSLTVVRSAHGTQNSKASAPEASPRYRATHVVVSESEEEDDAHNSARSGNRRGPAGTSSTKITATQSQITSTGPSGQARATQEKRSAVEPLSGQRAKRPRPALRAIEVADSDDSEDELKFRFGKRR
ncbi:DNA damage response protein RcaA [Metarhizium album ARSEF 1941]|uniref:DNA damage response protein RcaA n=1 Tax=Metarhizium album (strain ARSEF 1941) TaxID=1081103 RepID=A0A0B2WQQ7_METAS|nr:DNA damage response protein RcaA [Metarhizium album ARSEF 1941]KHN95974.1 DNA damage response protein RcaA [Metarhizium album ARSEF 1941]